MVVIRRTFKHFLFYRVNRQKLLFIRTNVDWNRHTQSDMDEYLPNTVIVVLQANDVRRLKSLRAFLGRFDRLSNNLLHVAISKQRFTSTSMIKAFEYLLTLPEINKDHVNMEAHSPLMCAMLHVLHTRDFPNYAIKLIKAGCDISIYFENGNTPLHLAVRNNWPEVVELLIERGANVDAQNDNEETPLFLAAKQRKSTNIIWMLLFYGADPYISRVFGIIYSGNDKEFLATYLTFFDLIYSYQGQGFLNQFYNYYRTFTLSTFVEAMQDPGDSFYELIDSAHDIYYCDDDLSFFLRRIFACDSEMFKRFFKQFEHIVEQAFQQSTNLLEFFFCYKPTKLQNFCENLFTLMESDTISTIVDKLNEGRFPLLMYLIKSFAIQKDQPELLTQVLCGFLSHGAEMTTDAMNELYLSFGYCDLFKVMLHMDIIECKIPSMPRNFWPTIIYSVEMDFDEIVFCDDYEHTTFSAYYTTPAMFHLRIPSLTELTRNALREYIIEKYQTRNSRQFYTVLKKLLIAEPQKAIISFEAKIY